MRQIVLDTETTGLEWKDGHRVIEFGAVELVDRKKTGNDKQIFFKPDIQVEAGAFRVHGISNERLESEKNFSHYANEIINYLSGAELIIHNASFDIPFLDAEFDRCMKKKWHGIRSICKVVDTLILARGIFPSQRINLDSLAKKYGVKNTHRHFHGALLDAGILSDVYLYMTGGQKGLILDSDRKDKKIISNINFSLADVKFYNANIKNESINQHNKYLKSLSDSSKKDIIW